jgi:hypothetical protein
MKTKSKNPVLMHRVALLFKQTATAQAPINY